MATCQFWALVSITLIWMAHATALNYSIAQQNCLNYLQFYDMIWNDQHKQHHRAHCYEEPETRGARVRLQNFRAMIGNCSIMRVMANNFRGKRGGVGETKYLLVWWSCRQPVRPRWRWGGCRAGRRAGSGRRCACAARRGASAAWSASGSASRSTGARTGCGAPWRLPRPRRCCWPTSAPRRPPGLPSAGPAPAVDCKQSTLYTVWPQVHVQFNKTFSAVIYNETINFTSNSPELCDSSFVLTDNFSRKFHVFSLLLTILEIGRIKKLHWICMKDLSFKTCSS